VQYKLIMEGSVVFLDGSFQTSNGTFSVEDRLTTDDVAPDPDSEIQCAGGCFDYTVTGVTDPTISVILPLNGGVPASNTGEVQLRVFRDDTWGNFDISGNNSVMSAAFTNGGDFGTTCPPPGDAAYGDLTEGHQCLQVTIEDNGPNDKNRDVGTISDPSGLGIPTIVQGPDTRSSGTSGCSVASTPVSPLRGGAWWLLAGLAAVVGWKRHQSKLH
jgi:MYXO-CTERM domain-containing protein